MPTIPSDKSKINYYHLPTWLTFANLVFLITLSFRAGNIQTRIEDGIETNRKAILRHETDYNAHMPYDKKVELFTPRKELQVKFEALKEQNDAIKQQLNRIESKINK